jgi:ArsR family transcriptional regulator, arsenate/arsenite/antimonite-responsive transcriptional repressor
MKHPDAVRALRALAHPSRLAVFRRLVRRGPKGLSAGAIATALRLPAPTLSFHLAHLVRGGLARSRREGRQVYYAVDVAGMRGLMGYLTRDCCAGRPELCLPATCEATPPETAERHAAR